MENHKESEHSVKHISMRRQFNPFLWGGILAALFLIAISVSWLSISTNTIYAAVIVDINPSIELDLNKYNKVIKPIALNTDAMTLDLLSLKGKPVEEALEMLIADAGAKGFFTKTSNDYILITTVAMKNQPVDALKASLVEKFENSGVLQRTNMALSNITPAQLNLAKENKVPAGLVGITPNQTPNSVSEFFQAEDNVKVFEDSGTLIKGNSVDTVTSASQKSADDSFSSSLTDANSSTKKNPSDDGSTLDLQERLIKLKSLSDPSEAILSFIKKADDYLSTGNGDLKTLTIEAKDLWDSVKSFVEEESDDDETPEHLRADLAERLRKLKGLVNPSESISNFIIKAEAYFSTNVGNLKALTEESKALWEKAKENAEENPNYIDDVEEDKEEDSKEDKEDKDKNEDEDEDEDENENEDEDEDDDHDNDGN